ncbi:MAG: AEC family transporter [Halocynthiibacter sp.]
MIELLLKIIPFFLLIGLGFVASRKGWFSQKANAALTKFVFFFALSAMLFQFTAKLNLTQTFDLNLCLAYLFGTLLIYVIATIVALLRKTGTEEAAVEAQIAVIGNTGFLGIPLLTTLIGGAAIAPLLLVLTIDLVVFSSLMTIIISAVRGGKLSLRIFKTVGAGLLKNPMIVSITAGFIWSTTHVAIPAPVDHFLVLLAGAATPGALFSIGASLGGKSAERLIVVSWLSFAKLILHPLAVAVMAFYIFAVDPFAAKVAVAAAALPVAGNVYMLAQYYGVAPKRVSSAIMISTCVSLATLTLIMSFLAPF